jgi:hypothetical protein
VIARPPRRLAGFRIEVQAPPLAESLPRMDVAVFVGFAATGPLHTPVVVEDAEQFAKIFGDDLPLAWDVERGAPDTSYLAPAVRAFLRNGGQRCWVVRVASGAQPNYFPLSGLLRRSADGTLTPAVAQAASSGRVSDGTEVCATLQRQPLAVSDMQLTDQAAQVTLAATNAGDLAVGDLLRLTFQAADCVALFAITTMTVASNAVSVSGGPVMWLSATAPGGVSLAPAIAYAFTQEPARIPERRLGDEPQPPTPDFTGPPIPVYQIATPDAQQRMAVDMGISLASAPNRGSLVRIDVDNGADATSLWLRVESASVVPLHELASSTPALPSPPDGVGGPVVRVTGQGWWPLGGSPFAPGALPLPDAAEKLTMSLWVQAAAGDATRLDALGLARQHPRFWAALPTAEQIYGLPSTTATNAYADLWSDAAALFFPLAGNVDDADLYVPVGMPFLPDSYLPPIARTALPLERDGLEKFDAGLFLDWDKELLEATFGELPERADELRYANPEARHLRGIFAGLAVDEATIIAVPDAVHRGWTRRVAALPLQPGPSNPLPRPEWWHFSECAVVASPPLVSTPQWGNFLDCGIRVVAPPTLSLVELPNEYGAYALAWSSPEVDAQFVLEEAATPAWGATYTLYAGADTRLQVHGRSPGNYYYRVRVVVGGNSSDWSAGVVVAVPPPDDFVLESINEYSHEPDLHAVHWALLRMCAARGDLFAVLALPEHYRETAAMSYVAALKSPASAGVTVELDVPEGSLSGQTLATIQPLGAGEAAALSYGAAYHPWLMGREAQQPDMFLSTPPDGATCGVLAQRAFARGAWIAPANEPLQGVAALTPSMGRAYWISLLEAQLNLIRQEPHGFLALSADTLSDDDVLRPINVRRLLILLRRLALRMGAEYVFEPNNGALHRAVQRDFETMLGTMFAQGAFAGAVPEQAFQVNAGEMLNPLQSVDQGRFIVELLVAPSQPLVFMTLRLVQTGQSGVVLEVG